MNGKHYIGKRASSLELYDEIGPITGVALIVDDKNKCFAGDESGYVLTAECPYATDQMAADALAKVQGKTYLGYRSTDTVLPVDAELGDGVTVGGIYSLLAYRKVSFGPGHMSEISAPGENEVDHEYPYVSSTKRETDRKLAQTRSMISKTAEAITQRVEDVEGAMSEFTVSLEGLSGRVEDAEGKAAEAKLTIDGFTVTDESGTTKIKGSKIQTETLEVDAANVSGTLHAAEVNLLGDVQVYNYYAQLGGHLGFTTSNLDGSAAIHMARSNSSGTDIAEVAISDYAVKMNYSGYGEVYCGPNPNTGWGIVVIASGMDEIRFQHNESGVRHFYPNYDSINLGLAALPWGAVYTKDGTVKQSDRNLKHNIEDLPQKYIDLVMWLAPKRFQLNHGESGRYHVGFIAQDVEEGMALFGIDSLEFGGCVKDRDEAGNDIYMLRYEEFIAIILAAVQKQQKIIDYHEERLKKLEAMMNG